MAANMNPTTSMIHLDVRLASYTASSSQPSKSRSKKSQAHASNTYEFPLDPSTFPNLTPTSLAAAGFFFHPAEDVEDDDTCQCFLCGLKLGGWDEGDDPFEEHVKRQNCPWAEFVCQARLNRRKGIRTTYDTSESLPSSAESSKWREQTYQKWWPHKQKSAWLPTVKNLAKAGFVFYPSSDATDLVVCPFCDYGVEGWEATDDPWAIHYKKSPLCEFFTTKVGESSEPAEVVSAKSKAGGRKTKRGTTASKATSAAPESILPSEDDVEQDDVREARAALGRSTSTKSSRQPKPRVTSRSKSKTRPIEEPIETDVGVSGVEQVGAVETPVATRPRKTGRGKGKKKAEVAASDADSEALSGAQDEEEAEVKPAKGRRSRKKKGDVEPAPTAMESEVPVDVADEPPVAEKKQRGRKKKSTKEEDVAPTEDMPPLGLGQPESSNRRHITRSASGRSAQSQQSGLDDGTDASESVQESEADMELPEVEMAPDVDVELPEDEAVEAERTIRATSPPSKQSSKSSKPGKSGKTQTSQSSLAKSSMGPRSQLDRFANIPPSSPFPTPLHPSQVSALQPPPHSPAESTPRPKSTLVSNKPSKASPHTQLPRETLNKSLAEGAREARKVMDDLVLNSTGDEDLKGLSEEQQGMTLEELVRGEMKKRYESLKLEGEEMIRKWEERGREARRKIESV